MTMAHNQVGPCIELERSLPSEVAAISPFVDRLMLLFRKCGCLSEGESGVEIALREALANAIIHGNHENPGKHVHVGCRCEPSEISIAVKDEGRGFDVDTIADPTAPENHGSIHGRGIYLMKALMDEVRFEDGGVVVLNGTTQWPGNKVLRRLGETRMTGTPAKIREILERVSDALSQTEIDLRSYIKEHPDFKEVGERMLQEWVKGQQLSLQGG